MGEGGFMVFVKNFRYAKLGRVFKRAFDGRMSTLPCHPALFFGTQSGRTWYQTETVNLTEHGWWRDGIFCGKKAEQKRGQAMERRHIVFSEIHMIGPAPRLA